MQEIFLYDTVQLVVYMEWLQHLRLYVHSSLRGGGGSEQNCTSNIISSCYLDYLVYLFIFVPSVTANRQKTQKLLDYIREQKGSKLRTI